MKSKNTLSAVLLAVPLCTWLSLVASARNADHPESPRQNVLFIIVDDLRTELGCYGNTVVSTPNIDRLASKAATFKRAYCNVPVCGASRASLLTGTRPTDYRFLDFRSRADHDSPEAVTLPGLFRENGYHTVSLGKIFHFQDDSNEVWNENSRPQRNSLRDYLNPENIALDAQRTAGMPYEMADVPDSAYADGKLALQGVEYLKRFGQTGQPFFLAVGFSKPHLPFNAPKKYWDLYDPEKIGLSPAPESPRNAPAEAFHPWRELRTYHTVPPEGDLSSDMALKLRHAYYACVSYTDAQIGLLLDELSQSGLDKNTIVVLLGDHGWNLGDNSLWGKHCNFNKSMNAPLIIRAPGMTSGETSHSITEFIDIYPTLAELCNLPPPAHLDGQSLVSRLKNPGKKENDYAISKFSKGVTLIQDHYLYTEWYDKADQVVATMLYDHRSDPEETVNLSVKPEYARKIRELSRELREKRGKDFFR